MPVVHGVDGGVTYASGYTHKATSWTINMVAEEVDITALGENWKTFLAGVKEWSGSYTAHIADDQFTTGTDSAGASWSSGVFLGGTAATATFDFGTDNFHGSIIITGVDATIGTAAGAGAFTFTFRGTSTLSIAGA